MDPASPAPSKIPDETVIRPFTDRPSFWVWLTREFLLPITGACLGMTLAGAAGFSQVWATIPAAIVTMGLLQWVFFLVAPQRWRKSREG